MVIYYHDNKLKCAPFGINSNANIVYGDINPFSVPRWQHISCTFRNGRFIKGHYLAVNLDTEGPLTGFEDYYRNAQTFYKSISDVTTNRDNF